MKKLIFIIISAIMLFAACGNQTDNSVEESVQTQIDPAEEFGGILFGMTKEEVIEFHGKEPDYTFEHGTITYENETFFNISNANADYVFDDNEKLDAIFISYTYYKDSEDNSFQDDYDSIKRELITRYPYLKQLPDNPNESFSYVNYGDDEFMAHTDNRSIILLIHNSNIADTISITISDMEKYNNTDT